MQEHILPDFSLITLKFPDFSRFFRWVSTLQPVATKTAFYKTATCINENMHARLPTDRTYDSGST